MELAPGTLVAGRYRIGDALGQGGASWVYRARDTRLEVDVALKSAPPQGPAGQAGFRARVQREAKIGFMLGRVPGIVRCLDWGPLEDGRSLFIVLELVEDARALDLHTGPLEVRLRRLLTATSRVAACHERGVIHRDVKPQNFLVSSDGTVFLTDFGSAKVLVVAPDAEGGDAADLGRTISIAPSKSGATRAPQDADPETHTGTVFGTPLYMAPEQFRDPSQGDPRLDVFSLGVMLYHVMTGTFPYVGGDALEIMSKQVLIESGVEPPPAAPRSIDPSIAPALDALCRAAISLRADDRPGDACELHEHLSKVAGLVPASASHQRVKRPASQRHHRGPSGDARTALALEPGGFTPGHKLREAALRLGLEHARAIIGPALALVVSEERDAGAARSYRDAVALLFPSSMPGHRITLGRVAADLVLDLVTISKLHLVFEREGTRWVAIEAGSSNGTRFNGGPLEVGQRQSLADGDELRLADHVTLQVAEWRRLARRLGLPER